MVVARNPLAARIVEHAGATEEVELDWLEAELGNASRFDIVASLKELENAGAGTFVVGRRGRKSRFVWKEHALARPDSGAEAAAPLPSPRPLVSPRNASLRPPTDASSPPLATLQHSFHLRPGVVTRLDLPADVTKAEVDRLCGFLQSIPFQ